MGVAKGGALAKSTLFGLEKLKVCDDRSAS